MRRHDRGKWQFKSSNTIIEIRVQNGSFRVVEISGDGKEQPLLNLGQPTESNEDPTETDPEISPLLLEAHRLRELITQGGGIYRGLWRELGLVLFDDPATRSTLALPISAVTALSVMKHLSEQNIRCSMRPPDSQ